jgi:hypothetical protein
MIEKRVRFGLVAATCALHAACRSAPSDASPAPAAASAAVSAPGAANTMAAASAAEANRPMWPVPVGPPMAILAGQGVGPIRFGATVATIERLMGAPCEFQEPDACRYVARGVEFSLKGGVVSEIHVHRRGRTANPTPRTFGIFNGTTPEGLAFFMLPRAVDEFLGKPLRAETVPGPNPWNMVDVAYYKGIRIEFDRIENGNVVVGGMVVTPDPTLKKPVASPTSASKPSSKSAAP